MKNKAIIFLGLISILSMSGCTVHRIETEYIKQIHSIALNEGSEDSLRIDISLEWARSGLPPVSMENLHKSLITSIFGKEYKNISNINKAIEDFVTKETEQYRESGNGFREMIRQNGEKESEGMFSWSQMMEGHFLHPYENMQSYLLHTYGYTGGNHGMDTEKGMTFNLSDGTPVTEDDLFRRDYRPELSEILSERLPKCVSEEAYSMLFIKSIEPNGNFFINEKGITYIYGRYEIGPYVSGIVHVSVPWEELEDILR